MPGDKTDVEDVEEEPLPLLNGPSRLELHLHPVIEPSESVPCPLKVTVAPSVAGLGVMESITAPGGLLAGGVDGWTVKLRVAVDEAPSSSCT